jgi:hypothetical protein
MDAWPACREPETHVRDFPLPRTRSGGAARTRRQERRAWCRSVGAPAVDASRIRDRRDRVHGRRVQIRPIAAQIRSSMISAITRRMSSSRRQPGSIALLRQTSGSTSRLPPQLRYPRIPPSQELRPIGVEAKTGSPVIGGGREDHSLRYSRKNPASSNPMCRSCGRML